MSFDSIFFISCFLPVLLAVYWLIPGTKAKNWVLLVVGLVFYAFGGLTGIGLLLAAALGNFLLGLLIQKNIAPKAVMVTAVVLDLAFLCAYKYLDFILVDVIGLPESPVSLVAPVGISFFVFKCISYIVDVYRNGQRGTKNFAHFLLYISFFPQVMAGPITRFHDFGAQLESRGFNLDTVSAGLRRFVVGLSKKAILCGALGSVVDAVFALESGVLDARLAWLGAIAYMLQIYFDFSGYSDMAIGIGGLFGFNTIENFDYPYIAASVGDFWRRWHIGLSSWFKDYLYIPLGGNRKGAARAALNKAIVFTLCGLWHGSAWTFLLWGAWHGLFSALESLKIINPKAWRGKALAHMYTLLVVGLGFVMFRAGSIAEGMGIIGAMFTGWRFTAAGTVALHSILTGEAACMMAAGILFAMPIKNWAEHKLAKYAQPASYAACLVLYVICLAKLASGGFAPFIYFQF